MNWATDFKERITNDDTLVQLGGRPVLVCQAWRSFDLLQGVTVAPAEYKLPSGLRTIGCGQVHGAKVVVIHDQPVPDSDRLGAADGLLTDRVGLILTVRVADCVPVGLYAPGGPVVGLLHAGWRGIAAGILEEAVRRLVTVWRIGPEELHLFLGPAVEGACYPVGPEVWEAVHAGSAPRGTVHLDLRAALRDRAQRLGIPPIQTITSSLCTVCRPDLLPSHRRDGPSAARAVAFLGVPV